MSKKQYWLAGIVLIILAVGAYYIRGMHKTAQIPETSVSPTVIEQVNTPSAASRDVDARLATTTGGVFAERKFGFGFEYLAHGYVLQDTVNHYYKLASSSTRVQVFSEKNERLAVILVNYGFEGDAGEGDTYQKIPLQIAGTSTVMGVRTEHNIDPSKNWITGSVSFSHGSDFYYIGFPYTTPDQKRDADQILKSFHF